MRSVILLVALAFSPIGCAASDSLAQIESQDISFVLNKLSILLDSNDPNAFPAKARLILIPDQDDKCEWIDSGENIPTAIIEDSCPKKKLLLTLTNWDQDPEFYTYDLGSALSWSIISLEVSSRKNMSHWDAHLILEALLIDDKGLYRKEVSFDVKNRGDTYTVDL